MRNRIFLALVIATLLVVGGGYISALATGPAHTRVRFGLRPFEPSGLSPADATPRGLAAALQDGRLQAGVRTFLRDEFIGFDNVLMGYSASVTKANRVFYRWVLPSQRLVPLGIDSADMFLDKANRSIVGVTLSKTTLTHPVAQGAKDALRLAKKHPDVNFAYYGVSSWTMTDAAPKAGYVDPLAITWREFEKSVEGSAAVGSLQVDEWDEMFFATDHHWKPAGAYQGYLDVVGLLAKGNPLIGAERVPFGQRVIKGVDFRGASARRAAFAGIKEKFRIITKHDPDVHAYLKGKRTDSLIVNRKYLKAPSNKLFYSHYEVYNGTDYAVLEFRKDKPGAGNLLVLGDSFCNGMDDLIASHYQRMYRVDLRYYKAETGAAFDIDKFIVENDITDVLFMGRPYRVMTMPTLLREKKPLL